MSSTKCILQLRVGVGKKKKNFEEEILKIRLQEIIMYQSKKKYLIFFTLGLIRLGNLTPSNNSLFDDEAIKSRFGSGSVLA